MKNKIEDYLFKLDYERRIYNKFMKEWNGLHLYYIDCKERARNEFMIGRNGTDMYQFDHDRVSHEESINSNNGKNGKYMYKSIHDGSYYDEWYLNGKLHREDGPAIEYECGNKIWMRNGKRHREDGPAFVSNFAIEWWINGKRHREDGPSSIFLSKNDHHDYDDSYSYMWHLNDVKLTEKKFNIWLDKKNLNERLHVTLTEKNKIKRPKI